MISDDSKALGAGAPPFGPSRALVAEMLGVSGVREAVARPVIKGESCLFSEVPAAERQVNTTEQFIINRTRRASDLKIVDR